ncbi:MAG: MTH938/NDUFAF3 family protein [Gammaproteobacteria bacterium]|nr:MTH938/NDUFAF3 family protein [Gammaproteobacteria bacterium]MCW9031983.1 MTH938/NDUFAF3 family protein [Gammaproteobacteria bacterium]
MKFVLETGQNILVHGYDINEVTISGINADHPELKSGLIDDWDADNHLGIFRKSVVISADGTIKSWSPQNISELNPEHFLGFSESNPEVVLLGMGQHLRFPSQDCLAVLQQQNLGYEVMDTAAACRTFNVLAAEGREVILAMLMIEKNDI